MRILLTLTASIIIINCTFGQNQKHVKEDIYLITDRSVYISGETVLFSAFYSSDFKSQLSNILYVELYNKRATYSKSKFKIIDNHISGQIQIPVDLLSGNYFIRAYTKYQRNFPKEQFQMSLISVINPKEAFPNEYLTDLKPVESVLHDYSEDGSELILRLNEDKFQHTKNVIITNNKDSIIKEHIPNSNGLVIFKFDHRINDTKIKLINNNNDTSFYSNLKDIKHSYVSIQSDYSNKDNQSLNLYIDKRISSRYEYLKLLIKSSDFKSLDIQRIKTDDASKTEIDNRIFKQNGIFYFLILDENDNIINITPYYILKYKTNKVRISLNKEKFNKREEVKLKAIFETPSIFDHAIIKVVKTGLNNDYSQSLPRHILFDLNLLNSYLKFRSIDSPVLTEQLNASLSLNKDQINSDSFKSLLLERSIDSVKYFPDIREISVEGKITDKKTGEPVKDVDVFASIIYGNDQLHHYRTGEDGMFIFSLNEVKEEQNLFITIMPIKKDISISVHNDFHQMFYSNRDIPLIADTADIELFTELFIEDQSKKIFHKDIINKAVLTEIEALNLNGQEDYKIILDDYVQTATMLQVLNELVPYLKVVKQNKEIKIRIFSELFNDAYDNPLILVDYIPVFDVMEILKINPKKVEKIETINQQYIIGDYQFNGIILIKTNTNDFADIKLPGNSIYLKYKTETIQTKPVFPEYNSEELRDDHKADFRNVLFFETLSGKFPDELTFYTSDSEGKFDLIFYGRTKEGEILTSFNNFVVE